jgi:hypothetical protein
MSKISLKKVSRDEFEAALLKGQRGYLKKSKSWKKTHLWWDNPKDPWFMHWAEDRKQGKSICEDKIGLLVASQMEAWYSGRTGQGYEFYLEE